MKTFSKTLKNSKGIITLDFLFAFTLIFGFTILFFSLALTLTVVEVTQYITFTAARKTNAAHLDENSQQALGKEKLNELFSNKVLAPLYKSGWFEVTNLTTGKMPGYADKTDKFYGAAVTFIARILDMQIPFYGSTAPNGDGTGNNFRTIIASYLGREPTTKECMDFNAQRWSTIRNLSVVGAAPYSTSTADGGYYNYADDGC